MKSWKTTTCGILAVAIAWGQAVITILDDIPSTNPDWNSLIALTVAAVGLLLAKDASAK